MSSPAPATPTVVEHSPTAGGCLPLAAVGAVVAHLRAGGLAVLPTETGYMLAALATSEPAVRAAFAAKDRPADLPMHVAVSSVGAAAERAEVGPRERAVIEAFCPGPLTTVCPGRGTLVAGMVEWRGTVGLRVPDVPATLQVLAELRVPVTATSLNRHGDDLLPTLEEQVGSLDWPAGAVVHVVRHDAAVTQAAASTLVRLTDDGVDVLRPGPVDRAAIEAVLSGDR
ncbi:MAG TPA: L-threonylcarbamoyladenylate synthase [Acidimicrobiales bacterium]